MSESIYYYISTRACYDPVKTIFVCAPEAEAASYEKAERFAKKSGWQQIAEEDGAVLVLPVVPHGWKAESLDLLAKIYDESRNSFPSQNGKSLKGRKGFLWCWETLVYWAGYEEGADFVGNAAIANPNRFAAAALINGTPTRFEDGNKPSSHWLVKDVSEDYQVKNQDIPVCLWMFHSEPGCLDEAVSYFTEVNHVESGAEKAVYDGIPAEIYQNKDQPAWQIRVSEGIFKPEPGLARIIKEQLFDHIIRWKNSPDGMLKVILSRSEFYRSPEFIRYTVRHKDACYDYFIHLPKGKADNEAIGLPLVFSIHGRGEPAWLFAQKNGWDRLADETGEFVLAVPDSPENIWLLERDGEVFDEMIGQISSRYAIDKSRVYLTGFSNGATITREAGTTYPGLFAALSPWNGPEAAEGIASYTLAPGLLESKFEIPYWVYVGDNDPTTPPSVDNQLEVILECNHCRMQPADQGGISRYQPDSVRNYENYYTDENGYKDGRRFQTYIYNGPDGNPRVGCTLMKNMPHGAVWDQSRASWEFLKHFRRRDGRQEVEYIQEDCRQKETEDSYDY